MKNTIGILLIIILLLNSCSTKVVSIYNTRIPNKKVAAFMVQSSGEHASTSTENDKLDKLLQSIIKENLELQGLKMSALPDIIVDYKINIFTSSETQNNNYNRSLYNSYYSPYDYYATRNYKEGVFIIEVKNSAGKLVWQGSKSFKISSRKSVQELLPEICQQIIAVYKIQGEGEQ
jgi:Domain of unknown function (DUF4136)